MFSLIVMMVIFGPLVGIPVLAVFLMDIDTPGWVTIAVSAIVALMWYAVWSGLDLT